MHPMKHSLQIDSVSITYTSSKGSFLAVSNATFAITRGECLALVGESGCGKTTLAKAIAGLLVPSKGTISLDDQRSLFGTSQWHKKIQLIFQDPDSVFNPKRTIGWHFDEAITLWHPLYSLQDKQNKIRELLNAVELSEEVLSRHSFELSGGQKQRASLVRSLLVEPEYLILDEPLASQDASKRKSLITLLKQLQATFHLGFLYITHDLSTLSRLADTVAVMHEGSIREMKTTHELLTNPEHLYTKKLLESRTKVLEKELSERDK